MRSMMRNIAFITAMITLTSSMCACGNKKTNQDSDDGVQETTIVETTAPVTTELVPAEDLDATPIDDFEYVTMTKDKYGKYGEDVLNKVVILDYKGTDTNVKVPSTCNGVQIVAIGEGAFKNKDIESIELPPSIEIIEDYAFSKCSRLSNINELESLKIMGRGVFDETQWLKDMRAGLSNTKPETTDASTDASQPDTQDSQESADIDETETVEATDSSETSDEQNQQDQSTEGKVEGIVTYSSWLVDGTTCSGDIKISNAYGLKAIAKDAFRLNTSIGTVDLTGTNIEFIDDYAFSESSVAIINLPKSLERFGDSAFSKCNALQNIDLSTTKVNELSDNLFSDSAINNIIFPMEVVETVDTEETTNADNSDTDETIESVEDNEQTSSTENVTTEPSTETSDREDTTNTESDKPIGITNIGYGTFNNCKNITSIDLGKQLKVISDYAFAGTGITEISLPDSLESIGTRAFSNCSELGSVKFGKSLTNISDEAFVKCDKLLNLTVPKNVETVGNNAFGYTYQTNEDDLEKINDIQIGCLKGSAIEKYCISNDIKYNIVANTNS